MSRLARPDDKISTSSPRTGGSVFRSIRLVGLAIVALAVSACGTAWDDDAPMDTFRPAGSQADKIFDLVVPVFLIAGVVFVLVMGAALYIAFKFRAADGDDALPEQTHGNTRLEIGWTILPAVILAFVAVFTVATILDLADQSEDALSIDVYGQQWWWGYEYDTNSDGAVDFVTANELVIPAGEEVNLSITSRDVIHSFWAPALNGKKDAVPGRIHPLTFEAAEPGLYIGQCTEFCGLSHAYMRLRVVALAPADYAEWVANQERQAVEPSTPAAEAGKAVFEAQCTTCHLIRGVNQDTYQGAAQVSGAAPDLTHFASRSGYAGAIFDLYQDVDGDGFGDPESGEFDIAQLEAWLRNPPAEKPLAPDPPADGELGRGMPNLNLTEQQIDDLVAYLTGLE
ncbi:MAG TPA: cytochrome c oxidase subunit II [Acidimicrobiales bacterium]|nr:cytochrome c oxidase subunit II [Acidimicrobiales bacterium]